MVKLRVSSLSPQPGQLEAMPDAECLKRLRSSAVGRIALVDHDVRPVIFPVNYFFDEGVGAALIRRALRKRSELTCDQRRVLRKTRGTPSGDDMEPTPGFEPGTFSLPRKCSTA